MTRYIKRGGKVWIKIFPDKPVTAKPAETRMGSGKGALEYWVAVVKPGRVMFEIAGVPEETAKEAGTTAYSLNAADLDASAFGGLDTKITEDTAVGTDDYFTLTGQGGKILISQKGEVTYGSNTFNQCICLSGALKDSGQAGIKITIPEGKTAKVTVYAAAKSEGASDMCYYNSSKELTTVDALAFGEVNKYTINDLASGSYWLGGSNGAYVYYAEVKYIEKYEVSMLNSDMEVGNISADTKVGTADFLTIIGKDAKNEIKDRSDAKYYI